MNLSDIFFAILYGGALIIVMYFLIGLFYKPGPSTVIVYNEDETPVYQEPVWPWWGGYNYWPTWLPWGYGGGYYGGGYYGRRWGPGRRWDGGHRWHGGSTRPFAGAGRGANVGAPRSGGGGGGGRGGAGGGGRR